MWTATFFDEFNNQVGVTSLGGAARFVMFGGRLFERVGLSPETRMIAYIAVPYHDFIYA